MTRTLLVLVLVGGLLAVPGGLAARPQDDGAAKKKAVPTGAARIVAHLHNSRVEYDKDLQTTPLPEVLADLAKRFEVTVVINKAAFETPAVLDGAKATNLSLNRLDGLTLHAFLSNYLRGLSYPEVTYLVRDDYIEVTSVAVAQKEAGLQEAMEVAGVSEDAGVSAAARARKDLPLVSVVAEDKPFLDVLKDLTRVYGLNVVVNRAERQRLTESVAFLRLLNVPADTTLELLAEQAGLEVVRKGNTFRLAAGGGV